MSNRIQDLPEYKGIQNDVQKYIQENVTDAHSAGMLANRIRKFFNQHKADYNGLLKKYNNDYINLCADMVSALNEELKEVPVKNPELQKLENEYKGVKHEMERLRELNPNLDPTDKDLCDLYTRLTKIQDQMKKITSTTIEDLRYKSTGLTGLLNEVMDYLSDIEPESQPSDLDARAKVVFNKKMGLDEALYTLLWNTRGQTLPLSVMNLKAWASRFVDRLPRPEIPRSNLPTMLVMRSRTDHGNQKGSTGKTRICHSCLRMLLDKGLNVTPPTTSIRVPTKDRVDKSMSDKTMVFMDDIEYKDCDWETLNNFCDGTYVKNRGKYQKEGYILPYGNILGTTNYDMPYNNKGRYPIIEFTEDDARTAQNDPVVKEHAKYKYDAENDVHDYSDAWETLFAYAKENSRMWMDEYNLYRKDLAQTCSTQRNKAEELVLAFLEQMVETNSIPVNVVPSTFHPREIVSWIKREYGGELKFIDIFTVNTVLNKLKIQRSNTTNNPYLAAYTAPTKEQLVSQTQTTVTQEMKWNWLVKNAHKPYGEQTSI